MKTYEVYWDIRYLRTIEANSKKEAIEIADDLGDINAETFQINDKKARVVKAS